MRPDSPRPLYAGPDDGPQSPFPVKVSGKVIKGFGRGSKEVRHRTRLYHLRRQISVTFRLFSILIDFSVRLLIETSKFSSHSLSVIIAILFRKVEM